MFCVSKSQSLHEEYIPQIVIAMQQVGGQTNVTEGCHGLVVNMVTLGAHWRLLLQQGVLPNRFICVTWKGSVQ